MVKHILKSLIVLAAVMAQAAPALAVMPLEKRITTNSYRFEAEAKGKYLMDGTFILQAEGSDGNSNLGGPRDLEILLAHVPALKVRFESFAAVYPGSRWKQVSGSFVQRATGCHVKATATYRNEYRRIWGAEASTSIEANSVVTNTFETETSPEADATGFVPTKVKNCQNLFL